MKQSTKPHAAEVILSELLASGNIPLSRDWIGARCVRECAPHSPDAVTAAFVTLAHANLITHEILGGMPFWRLTEDARVMLRTRPPYDYYRALRDELRASGPLSFNALRHACRRQACDYSPEQFTNALYALIRSGDVIDATEPDDTEASYEWMD